MPVAVSAWILSGVAVDYSSPCSMLLLLLLWLMIKDKRVAKGSAPHSHAGGFWANCARINNKFLARANSSPVVVVTGIGELRRR